MGEAGYNPLGYHTGTVWPHDNSLIAAGLARYGHHDAAGALAAGMLPAAPYFEYRLPEVFAGFPRP
jgi:glycogen debranching enzyme